MKLVTYSARDGDTHSIGAVLGGQVVDLPTASGQALPADMIAFLDGGDAMMATAREAIETPPASAIHALADIRLRAPLPRPRSIRDTLSFEGHMRFFRERTGRATAQVWYERPIYYKGNPGSVIGPEDEIVWPSFSENLDYELEVSAVIGTRGVDIPVERALDHVAGFMLFNDVSARDTIFEEVPGNLGPSKGKDFDTGNVLGPFLVTRDEIEPQNIRLEARINGELWSEGNSSDMRHSFAQIISFISRSETLFPGDVIGSGTCEKGSGFELGKGLSAGDVVELSSRQLGTLRNKVRRP